MDFLKHFLVNNNNHNSFNFIRVRFDPHTPRVSESGVSNRVQYWRSFWISVLKLFTPVTKINTYNNNNYIRRTVISVKNNCLNYFVFLFLFSSEIAKRLRKQCYSLVLQLNFFGALLTVAVMTLFFIQFNFLGITVPGRVSAERERERMKRFA